MLDGAVWGALHEDEVLARIPDYVAKTQGRAFVLFTSYTFLNRAAERLGPWFSKHGYTLLTQGTGLPTPRLLEQFRESRVMLGRAPNTVNIELRAVATMVRAFRRLGWVETSREMIAEACRPSGYLSIWPLAQSRFSTVKRKLLG